MKNLKNINNGSSGRDNFSTKACFKIDAEWLNADKIRNEFKDFDFSIEGRLRQANRMKNSAENIVSKK